MIFNLVNVILHTSPVSQLLLPIPDFAAKGNFMAVDPHAASQSVLEPGEHGSLSANMEEDLREHRMILQNIYDSSTCLMGIIELAGNTIHAININNAAIRFFAAETRTSDKNAQKKLHELEKLNTLLANQCRHCLGKTCRSALNTST